jgi:uncharacterized protein DUF2019
VHLFREHVLDQESALLDSDMAEYNRLYRKIETIEAELKGRSLQSRKALLVLRYEAFFRRKSASGFGRHGLDFARLNGRHTEAASGRA